MYYEINISLHGCHFFATADRSITDRAICCDEDDDGRAIGGEVVALRYC